MAKVIERGPTVSTHYGEAVLWYIDEFGQRWKFHRTAISKDGSSFELNQLGVNETLLFPGVIYREA